MPHERGQAEPLRLAFNALLRGGQDEDGPSSRLRPSPDAAAVHNLVQDSWTMDRADAARYPWL